MGEMKHRTTGAWSLARGMSPLLPVLLISTLTGCARFSPDAGRVESRRAVFQLINGPKTRRQVSFAIARAGAFEFACLISRSLRDGHEGHHRRQVKQLRAGEMSCNQSHQENQDA